MEADLPLLQCAFDGAVELSDDSGRNAGAGAATGDGAVGDQARPDVLELLDPAVEAELGLHAGARRHQFRSFALQRLHVVLDVCDRLVCFLRPHRVHGVLPDKLLSLHPQIVNGQMKIGQELLSLRALRVNGCVQRRCLLAVVGGALVRGFCSAEDAGSGVEVAKQAAGLIDHFQAGEVGFVLVAQEPEASQEVIDLAQTLLVLAQRHRQLCPACHRLCVHV
ncbi:hypothetical protein ACR6C2_00165 [Streptomyces sp. INA 01156]